MGRIKWYKRDPDAALNGFFPLTLEERGAYGTVLDLIYARDGNLPDDDRYLAGCMRCDIRVWKRIKRTLIALGKIQIADGLITNKRATYEVEEALSRYLSAAEAGRSSARSKATKSTPESKKNNDLASTDVGTAVPTTVPTNHNHNQNKSSAAAQRRDQSRAPPPSKSVDPKKLVYDRGRDLLTRYGVAASRQGAIITNWLKAVPPPELDAIFADALRQERDDVVAYVTGCVQRTNGSRGTHEPDHRSRRESSLTAGLRGIAEATADLCDRVREPTQSELGQGRLQIAAPATRRKSRDDPEAA